VERRAFQWQPNPKRLRAAEGRIVRPVRRLALIAVLLAAGCGGDSAPSSPRAAPAATPTPAPEPPPPRRPRTVRLTIGVSGDLLPHLPVVTRAQALAGGAGYDFAPMFRRIRPWVRRTDLALCHVETPLTPGPPAGYPVFSSPPALARAIRRTGWDACSTASNHTVDRGQAGVDATLRALDRAGVRHTGSYASRRGRRHVLMLRRRGVRIAFLSYTVSTNGIPPPHPWSVNLADPGRILRDARRARRAGARVVVVNLHWGTEYRHAPDAQQLALARRLARSRAITVLVGQHAHVVQPIRRLRSRWVVFGTGNLLSNQTSPPATQDGVLVRLHVRVRGRRARVERIRYTPTWVRRPDYTILRAGHSNRESWRRTVGVIGRARGLAPVP
jgi:poly-gamma-glutamate capsule biosynthesis protein CapA/YwtB (metallophosphatase superfamily)